MNGKDGRGKGGEQTGIDRKLSSTRISLPAAHFIRSYLSIPLPQQGLNAPPDDRVRDEAGLDACHGDVKRGAAHGRRRSLQGSGQDGERAGEGGLEGVHGCEAELRFDVCVCVRVCLWARTRRAAASTKAGVGVLLRIVLFFFHGALAT